MIITHTARPLRIVAGTPGLWLFLLLTVASPAMSQVGGAWELIEAVQTEQRRVEDYTVNITATADIPGMAVPEMTATLYFKQPDRMHVESDGFAMLPRGILTLNAAMLTRDAYDAILQGSAVVDGVDCRKVKVLALSDSVSLQRAVLYIDADKARVRRIDTDPASGAKTVIHISYRNTGTYSLPSVMTVEMDNPVHLRSSRGRNSPEGKRPEGKARIVIRYNSYKVNTGLDDALFTTPRDH